MLIPPHMYTPIEDSLTIKEKLAMFGLLAYMYVSFIFIITGLISSKYLILYKIGLLMMAVLPITGIILVTYLLYLEITT